MNNKNNIKFYWIFEKSIFCKIKNKLIDKEYFIKIDMIMNFKSKDISYSAFIIILI